MVMQLTSGDPGAVHGLLHPTGEFAARFMIVAMMITPLIMLLKSRIGSRWVGNKNAILAGSIHFVAKKAIRQSW